VKEEDGNFQDAAYIPILHRRMLRTLSQIITRFALLRGWQQEKLMPEKRALSEEAS
jgi:hypothetical protein